MKNVFLGIFVGIVLFQFSGCASTGFLMAKPIVSVFGNTYPPKDENIPVEVYFTSKPTQEYIEFALITCGDTENNWNINQILKEARRIGADAVILTDITEYWRPDAIGVIAVKYKTSTLIAEISR